MKKTLILGATALIGSMSVLAIAQDATTPPAEPTANGSGATVVRTSEIIPVTNEDNTTTDTTKTVQTVTTPSGNVNTLTKTTDVDGNVTTSVTHERAEHPGANARAERPERAERAERAERPERAERAERPERPERPDRPGLNN